ncbi:MAG: serine/threonine protein kinase [Spirochaetaceae bacterium]|nr:MAG: serine/threonine protein kinase [Spirochaetaceae bacterium]
MARRPDSVGKYKITSEIAKGGMGAVYKAQHPTLDRFVIIKKLTLRGDASIRERFRREARIMMDFKSDYIVDVYDHFREGSYYYIVLEYVDGVSLEQLLRKERYLPEEIALLVFRDCCRALAYAHTRGVVHRDIKPANILISNDGHVKLVDFGIASLHEEVESGLTRDGMTLGTPSYMAPEQFQSSRSVDRRADVYSMGVMLYEMLTGKKPFPGNMTAESIRLIQHGKYTRPRKVNPRVSRFAQRLIRRCMRVKPKRRFQELGPLLRILDKALSGKRRQSPHQRISAYLAGSWEPLKRRSAAARLAPVAGVLMLLLGAATVYVGQRYGYQYELLRAEQYGAFTLRVRAHKDDTRLQDMRLRAQLFVDDGAVIPEVEDLHFGFAEVPELETADYRVFESPRLFQPAGAYRVKLSLGDRLFWRSFHLAPRVVQREDATEAHTLLLEFALPVAEPAALNVDLQIRDALSGQRIADTQVWVRRQGRWVPFSGPAAVRHASLQTAAVHYIRIRSAHHYPAEYALRIEPHQRDLILDARLQPRPGALRIVAAETDVALQLDGRTRYLAGGRVPRLADVGVTAEEPVELIVAPGSYRLSAGPGDRRPALTVDIEPRRRVTVYLERGEAAGEFALRLGEQSTDPSIGE